MILQKNIVLPEAEIRTFCQQHNIRKLSLFGSILRDDFTPASDIDVLVEFEQGAVVTFFNMADMESQLSAMLGRKIDLQTPKSLSRYFRQDVQNMARSIYERA